MGIIARLQLKADQFSSESGRAFAEMATRAQAASQNVRQSFGSSFAEVKKLAEQALTLPRTATGSLDLSGEIASLRQAAFAADTHAAASRELGAAMLTAAGSARTVSDSMRLEADAAMVAARASEADASAIRQRIVALEEVQRELNKTASVTGTFSRAANDNTVATAQQRQSMMMLGQQTQDFAVQVMSGQSVTTAFAQQIGQAGFALQGFGGKLGAVGAFLGTGWGAAVLVGLTVLTPLVGKILEGNDALDQSLDKLKKEAKESEATARAQDIFARSAEGVAQAIREQTKALDESDKALRSRAEQANIDAKNELLREVAVRRSTLAMLEQARVLAENAKGQSIAAGGPGGAQSIVANQYAAEVERLERVAAEQQGKIQEAEQNVQRSRVDLAVENAKRATDPIAKLNKLYDDRIAAIDRETTAAIRNGAVVGAATQRKIDAIERERQAELKAERDKQAAASRRPTRDGDTATPTAVAKMLHGALPGVHVTSMTGGKHVDNSYHYRGQAIDFVPKGGMNSMTKEDVRRLFTSRGINIAELLGPGDKGHSDHFHVAWTKGKAALDEYSDAARRSAAAQREAEQAERELARSLDAVLGTFEPATSAARKYFDELAQIDKLVARGKLTWERGEQLKRQPVADASAARTRTTLDTMFDAAEADLRQLVERGVNAQRRTVDSWMTAADTFRYAANSLADMLGIRVSGPLRGLLQPGGIEGQAGDTAKALTDGLTRMGVKIDDPSLQKLTDRLGTVIGNAAYGQIGGSVFASITGGKQSKLGSSLGGILGGEAGKALGSTIASSVGGMLGKTLGSAAGPLGAIAGGILGSVVGGLFKKTVKGSAGISIDGSGSVAAGAASGTNAAVRGQAGALAGSVASGLQSIADQLGAQLTGSSNVQIGMYKDKLRVSTNGTPIGGKGSIGAQTFTDETAAVKYAIVAALRDGVLSGISAASLQILRSGQDLERAITKAMLIESVPKDLKAMLDPVGAAIDELNRKFKKTIDALKEGGATAEQLAQAERLYQLQLDQTKASTSSANQALKDFLAGMKVGSSSPYSLRDQEAAAKVALQPFLDQIASGKSIDQAKYQSAASAYLDVERQLYGSTKSYFDAMDAVQAATNKAISAIDNAAPIGGSVESPFVKATADSTAATANGVQVSNELLAQVSEQLFALHGVIGAMSGSSAASNDFIGAGRLFAAAVA